MGRYSPSFSLASGANDLTNDVVLIEVQDAVTNKVPTCRFDVNNRNKKWSSVLEWNDPILLVIDGETKFRGRLDAPDSLIGPGKGARILGLAGRGDGGALEDIVSSIHVDNMTPAAVVTTIMNEYANRKLSGDPAIPIESCLAPNDPAGLLMNWIWKRKNFWAMLEDVATQLGAPSALGGEGQFYDYYLNPETDGLIFEPVGHRDSAITILESTETLKAGQIIDSLTVKNDIWIWGDQGAGTLPLEMQVGYVGPGIRQDLWTENNASDYLPGDNVAGSGIQNDGTIKAFGSYSIKIPFSAIGGGARGYWRMPFPFGAPYPPGGSKWPAQPPGGLFNIFNETSMAETMGEINGIIFAIRNVATIDFLLEILDEHDYIVQSQSTHLDGATIGNWFTPEWKTVQLPFGPSASYKAMDPLQIFDWATVKEIRFVVYNAPAIMGFDVWFDGLAFIKPLVVRVQDSGATTRRSKIKQANTVSLYPQAKALGNAILENETKPQIYWNIDNLGRIDIAVGSKFKIGSTELLLREATYKMTKSSGWIITGLAWEAT